MSKEKEIENWKIKPEAKKITLYRYTYKDRYNIIAQSDWSSGGFQFPHVSTLLKVEAKEIEI